MEFEWDQAKSDQTFARRRFDFFFAARVFDDSNRTDHADVRRAYGEDRRQTIGLIDGKVYLVVYTMRGQVARIISARRAHDNEEDEYRAALGQKPID